MDAIRVERLAKDFEVPVKEPGWRGTLRYFFQKTTKSVEAVRSVSFNVPRGELVGFLGPNGAGKTTTLKLLSGLLYPSSGDASVLGYTPWKRENAFLRRFSMVMGQRTQLWWDLPARETFVLNRRIYEIPEPEFKKRVDEMVELLELKELIDVPVKKLSLGERMKAELACAILHQPEILLLDEPTLGLDIVMQKKLRAFIREYNRRTQSTILLTSHNITDVEELCRRVLIIDEGQILYDGDLQEIVQRAAPDKLVSLTASRPLDRALLEKAGRIVQLETTAAKIEVPRRQVSSVIGQLLARLPILDLSIEELPIEEIVRRIFLRHSASAPPPGTSTAEEPLPRAEDSLRHDRSSS